MTSRGRRPNICSDARGVFVKRKHDAVCDQRFECEHLTFERLPVPDCQTISAQALEHRDCGDRQPSEVR